MTDYLRVPERSTSPEEQEQLATYLDQLAAGVRAEAPRDGNVAMDYDTVEVENGPYIERVHSGWKTATVKIVWGPPS